MSMRFICIIDSKARLARTGLASPRRVGSLRGTKAAWRYMTDSEYRACCHERQRNRERAIRARHTFLRKHGSDDSDDRSQIDMDALIVGSTAWLISEGLDTSFSPATSNHDFDESLNMFDNSNGFMDSSSNWNRDYVTGGTDCTGAHGMGGHHDQLVSTDSYSSHDSFGSGL
jgi:hypothetical protein